MNDNTNSTTPLSYEVVFSVFKKRGTLEIFRLISDKPLRFTDIQHQIELPPRTLSLRLAELTKLGLVERTQYDVIPPKVEYSLNEKGKLLLKEIETNISWISSNL